MKTISSYVKSDRSAKCEIVLVSSITSQTVNLANLVGMVSFFGILGFRGVNISKVLGSVIIFIGSDDFRFR